MVSKDCRRCTERKRRPSPPGKFAFRLRLPFCGRDSRVSVVEPGRLHVAGLVLTLLHSVLARRHSEHGR